MQPEETNFNVTNIGSFTCSASSLVSSWAGIMALDFEQTSVKFVVVLIAFIASFVPDQLL